MFASRRLSREILVILGSVLLFGLLLGIMGGVSTAWAATPIYVRPDGDDVNCDGTVNIPYPGGGPGQSCAVQTVQRGIDLVDVGGTVQIAAGVYTETIQIDKHLSLRGAGSGSDPTGNTILRSSTGSAVITLRASGASAADPILLQSLRVEPVQMIGIDIPAGTVSFIKMDDLRVIGTNEETGRENERGLNVQPTASLTHLEVSNSAFDHLTDGWYFFKEVSADTSVVEYITVTDTSFSYNGAKGIYVEKLSNATFRRVTVHNNGIDQVFWNKRWNAGFDINLKAGDYHNLTFDRITITANALGLQEGVGIMIKARDDGNYSSFPATLDNVTVTNCTISGNERGIRFGEPYRNNATPTRVFISRCLIYDNRHVYSNSVGYGGIVNMTTSPITVTASCVYDNDRGAYAANAGGVIRATGLWWGHSSGPYHPTANPTGQGNEVSDYVDFANWQTNGCNLPTAVVLASFDASSAADGGGILLRWETAAETDNLGFNLYRSALEDRVRLNDRLIAAQNPGSPIGARYHFADTTAIPGVTYRYWLEAVDVYGGTRLYGPILARSEPLRRLPPIRPRLPPSAWRRR